MINYYHNTFIYIEKNNYKILSYLNVHDEKNKSAHLLFCHILFNFYIFTIMSLLFKLLNIYNYITFYLNFCIFTIMLLFY